MNDNPTEITHALSETSDKDRDISFLFQWANLRSF